MIYYWLGIEEMVEGLLVHSFAGIANRYFHVCFSFAGADRHESITFCKLSGIICQRIKHEEGEHSVGLDYCGSWFHFKCHLFHIESCTTMGNNIEESLKWETLDMEIQTALTQLNPLCQHIIIFIDLIGQFLNIAKPFLPYLEQILLFISRRFSMRSVSDSLHFMDNTVYEWYDADDKCDLGPLFQMLFFVALHPHPCFCNFFLLLFQDLCQLVVLLLPAVHAVEDPK